MPVDQVAVQDIESVLAPIWLTETAMLDRGRIEAVLGWETLSGYRTGENPARWRHNLDALRAKPGRGRRVEHHPSLAIAFALRGAA